jgi:hypothetical protein
MMAMKRSATSTGTLLRAFIDLHCPAERNGEGDSAGSDSAAASYFSFTKSNTKIAHTPTVMGNCTKEVSRSAPPLGRTYVAAIIARAVSTPRANLLFQFMRVRPSLSRLGLRERQRLYTLSRRDRPGGADLGWENQRTIQRTMAAEYQPFIPIVSQISATGLQENSS